MCFNVFFFFSSALDKNKRSAGTDLTLSESEMSDTSYSSETSSETSSSPSSSSSSDGGKKKRKKKRKHRKQGHDKKKKGKKEKKRRKQKDFIRRGIFPFLCVFV